MENFLKITRSPDSMENLQHDTAQIKARNVSTHDLLHAISKLKWLILIFSIAFGCFSFWFVKTRVLTYTSFASFYITDNASTSLTVPNVDTKTLDGLLTGENFNRIYQLFLSTRTQNYLIRKFHLMEHYHIDSTKEFSHERVVNKLKKNIEIKKSPFNLVTITVSDEYRYLAAEMANEIISFVDKLNKEILIETLQRKISIYKGLITEIQKTNLQRTKEIENILHNMNVAYAESENKKQTTSTLLELQQRMSGIISEIEQSNTELSRIQRYNLLSMQMLKQKNIATMVMIQYATPSSNSLNPQALLVTMVLLLLLMTFFILLLYWKLRYGVYFRLFIRR